VKLEAADYVAPAPPLPPEPDESPAPAPSEREIANAADAIGTGGDRCLAIPEDDGVAVTWTLTPDSARIEAFFFVRIVVITPSWDGPTIETRDILCDAAAGSLKLAALPPSAVVRVAIGRFDHGTFVPIAHSPAIEKALALPLGTRGEADLVIWTLEGFRPYVPDAVV
jgi:hypothetical protein